MDFDRDRAADRRLAQGQVRQGARARRSQYRRAQRRPRLWRDSEIGGRSSSAISTPAPAEPGLYRTVTGAEALGIGLVAGAQLAGPNMFFGSYPITPARPILHHLSRLKEFGITTFQAEDEIAAICAAIGASYAGSPRAATTGAASRSWANRSPARTTRPRTVDVPWQTSRRAPSAIGSSSSSTTSSR